MGHAINKFVIVLFVLATFACIAVAQELPPSPPSDAFGGGSGGGGGGGGGGTYTPPVFEPYVLPLTSNDGTVIGSVTGKDFSVALLHGERNATFNGSLYTVILDMELGQKPDGLRMNLDLKNPDGAYLPIGMYGAQALAVVNVTRTFNYGWVVKADTPKMTVKVPKQLLDGAAWDTVYYLVRYDGTNYQVNVAKLKGTEGDCAVFEVALPADSGVFTLVKAVPAGSSASTTTVTPSTGASTNTETTSPAGGMTTTTYLIMAGLFVVGAVAGALVLFLVSKK